MTLGLALVLFGALLIYAGVTGRSVKALLVGDANRMVDPRPSAAPTRAGAGDEAPQEVPGG